MARVSESRPVLRSLRCKSLKYKWKAHPDLAHLKIKENTAQAYWNRNCENSKYLDISRSVPNVSLASTILLPLPPWVISALHTYIVHITNPPSYETISNKLLSQIKSQLPCPCPAPLSLAGLLAYRNSLQWTQADLCKNFIQQEID